MRKILFSIIFSLILYSSLTNAQISSVSVVDDTVFGTGGKMIVLDWGSLYSDRVVAELITPDKFKSETGYSIDRSFTLQISPPDTQYAIYPVQFLETLWFVELRESPSKSFGWDMDELQEWVFANCEDWDGDGYYYYSYKKNVFGITQAVCFGKKDYAGILYSLEPANVIWKVTWKLQPEGKDPAVFTLSNDNNVGKGMTSRYDNLVLVRWKGSFSTGAQIPDHSAVYYTYSKYGNTIIDSTLYNTYNSIKYNDFGDILLDYSEERITKEIAEERVNDLVYQLLTEWTTRTEFSQSKIVSATPSDGVKLDLASRRIFIPAFQVLINGEYYVKVVVPSGIPKIEDMVLPTLTEGYPADLVVYVRNIGEDVGDFEVSITCTPEDIMRATVTRKIVKVNVGETVPVTFEIYGEGIEKDTSYQCTAIVKDTVSGKTDTMTKTGYLKHRVYCKEGEQIARRYDDTCYVYECRDGVFDYSKPVLVCEPPLDCVRDPETGKYSCVKISVPPAEACAWWDITCKISMWLKERAIGIMTSLVIIIIILALIVYLLMFGFPTNLLRSIVKRGK